MAEIIVPVDVEDKLRRHLTATLPAAGMSGVTAIVQPLPTTLPVPSVLIRRTGGPMTSLVTDQAQITFECRHATTGKAVNLANLVRGVVAAAALDGLVDDTPCYRVVDQSGPYVDPDPDHPTITRVSVTMQVTVRARVAG